LDPSDKQIYSVNFAKIKSLNEQTHLLSVNMY